MKTHKQLIEKVRELIDLDEQLIDEAAEVAMNEGDGDDIHSAHLVLKARAALELGAVLSVFYLGDDAKHYSCEAKYDADQDLMIVMHSFK